MMARPVRYLSALPLLIASLSAIAAPDTPAPAGTAPAGHALHATNCVKCHGPEIYTREDRKVASYDGLNRQVRRCETALGLRWFDDEIDAVTALLNRDFYRFMPEQ